MAEVGPKQYLMAAVSTMLIWGLEYYDIILFPTLSSILKALFFPEESGLVAAVATWGAFAATYIARPAGAVIFGHIGDKFGRRAATILDSAAVGLAGLAIGLLPTYSAIGVAAPIALYALRVIQGLGIGGEAGGGATWALELTPQRWRPYVNGLMYSGLSWAVFLASGAALWASDLFGKSFDIIGWRVLYILGVAPALIALAIRLGGAESPEWLRARAKAPKAPIAALRKYLHNLAVLFAINLGLTFFFYGGSGYWTYIMPDVVAPKLGLNADAAKSLAFELSMYGGLGAVVGELISGFLVSALGYRLAFILPSAALAALSPLATATAFSLSPSATAFSFLMGVFFGLAAAPQTLYFTTLFPAEVRWTTVSFGWNINAAIAPLGSLASLLLVQGAEPPRLVSAGSTVMIASALLVIAGALIKPKEY